MALIEVSWTFLALDELKAWIMEVLPSELPNLEMKTTWLELT
ncbi:MAG: hypothetical protein QHH75_12365 [Bacillota bacterium]|nr:hypothetical protein [Bacillota bacterium]